MTRRAQHRGERPAGLFVFADPAAGDVEPDEVRDNPRTRPCPACGAAAAHPCVTRSRIRHELPDYHDARKQSAAMITEPAVRLPNAAVDGLNRPPTGDATGDGLRAVSPGTFRVYRVCGECWHAYATADELIEADYAARRDIAAADGLAELVERRDPDLIHVCPLCTHDF